MASKYNIRRKSDFVAGFTLVELLVAMAVFSVTVVTVSSIFVGSINAQRKNINTQEVLDNGRFILENIGRAIRQSDIVTVDGSGASLTMIHPTKGTIAYTLSEANQVTENDVALSANSVFVERLNFVIYGNGTTDQIQPRVTISLSLRNILQKIGSDANINLQTTVTPRNLQIQQ